MKFPRKPNGARTWYTIAAARRTTDGLFRAVIFIHNDSHGWVYRFGAAYGESSAEANSRAFDIVTMLHASELVRA